MEVILTYILPFIFTLGIIVLVHELGHFLLAKAVGVRVERFSIGFPPRLFGKKIGDTDYCISAVPLGGYVKMTGMIDESMDAEGLKGEPYEFMSKPTWARFLIIFAGPFFNFLLTAGVFAAAVMASGVDVVQEPSYAVVGQVLDGKPAAELGLQSGDEILTLDGQPVEMWDDLVAIVKAAPEEELSITWKRGQDELSGTITPEYDLVADGGLIGVSPVTVHKDVGFFSGIGYGVKSTYNLTALTFRSFGMFFSGKVSVKDGLAGPVKIAQMTGETAKAGLSSLIMWVAFLSLNIGLINLFPIPGLDGGHIMLLGIEGIMRRPLSTKTKMVVQQIGMALLLSLMVFMIINDVLNIFK